MITYNDAIELRIAYKKSLDNFLDEASVRFEKQTGRHLSGEDAYYYDSKIIDAISRVTTDFIDATMNGKS